MINQEQISLHSHPLPQHESNYLNKDLVAVLFNNAYLNTATCEFKRFQLVFTLPCLHKLFFFLDSAYKLQEYLHQRLTFRQKWYRQSCTNLTNCDVRTTIEETMHSFPQQLSFLAKIIKILLIIRIVNFDKAVGIISLNETLIFLRSNNFSK